MNKKINWNVTVDKGTVVILYQRYKESLFSVLILLISILLFFFIIAPQINEFIAANSEERVYEEKIRVLRANIAFIKNLDETELDSQLKTVSTALPIEKDFIGIFTAISSAANRTNVLVGDFTFSLGELSTGSAHTDPTIQISLKVNGKGSDIRSFAKRLMEELPLSNIDTVNLTNSSGTLLTGFYYRPVTSVTFDAYTPLTPLSTADKSLINTLKGWEKNSGSLFDIFPAQAAVASSPEVSPPQATSSAISL